MDISTYDDQIVSLYFDDELSTTQIAERLNLSCGQAVAYRIRRRGLTLRTRKESTKLRWDKVPRDNGHLRGPGSPHWKGGRRLHTTGYWELNKPEHPRARSNGYVSEHIVIWEQHNGEPLPDGWHVHHLNGVKTDNAPKNLKAMPSKKHMLYIPMQAEEIRKRDVEIERLQRKVKELGG